MDIRLPIPKNWQDFETICHRLWTEIWNDLDAQKNGRQGQAQCGVDIFGKPIYSKNYHGVQCKDKDNRLGSILTSDELEKECNKAKDFKPQISSYTLATTSQRDEGIQEFYRRLNENKTFPFNVNVWSWDDIEAEIAYRPIILNHFYSTIQIPETNISAIKLNRHSTKEHFYAFFSRPKISETISKKFKSYLMPLVYELIDNAYLYGNASQYEISIEKNKIELKDNGKPFDPTKELDASKASSKSNIGSFVFKTFVDKFTGQLNVKYSRTDNKNILEFIVDESILNLDDNTHFELSVDLKDAYGRENAKHLASKIPTDKEEIVLNVTDIFNVSVFVEFTQEALSRMTDKQTLTMSLPRHEYLASFGDWFNDERLRIKMR